MLEKIYKNLKQFLASHSGANSHADLEKIVRLPARWVLIEYSRIEYSPLNKHGAHADREYVPVTKFLGNRLFG